MNIQIIPRLIPQLIPKSIIPRSRVVLFFSILLIAPFSTFADNETLGTNAGAALTSGDNNVLLGDLAGESLTSGSNNTLVGESAGNSLTTTSDNTYIGQEAGFSDTSGTDNTFIGTRSGYSNTASDNTFIGTEAGYANTTGSDNTFVGEEAGESNTTGDQNTFVGEDAGLNNTTGSRNTFVGRQAAVGSSGNPLTGHNNTAVGNFAGSDLEGTGSRNTFLGSGAGQDVGEGVGNTMLGAAAGTHTEHADFNVFIGLLAGYDNNRSAGTDTANRNTAIGTLAGYNNRTGEDNVWLGAFASSDDEIYTYDATLETDAQTYNNTLWFPSTASLPGGNTSVNRTTVLGSFANANDNDSIAIGHQAIADNTETVVVGNEAQATGNGDTVIGYSASNSGNHGIVIGNAAAGSHTEAVTIGYNAASHADYTVVLGNANTLSWDPHTDATTSLGTSSYRFSDVFSNKLSVNAAIGTAAEIDLFADAGTANDDQWTLRADDGGDFSINTYATGADVAVLTIDNTGNATLAGDLTLNSDSRLKQNIQSINNALVLLSNMVGTTYQWKDSLGRDNKTHYGLVAQNVEQAIPELVSETNGVKSVNYAAMVPVLVNAVNELSKQTKHREEEIELLKQQVALQQALLKQQQSENY